MYKVVQIWPGQTVTCLHTNSPGHIWTTLYLYCYYTVIFVHCPTACVSISSKPPSAIHYWQSFFSSSGTTAQRGLGLLSTRDRARRRDLYLTTQNTQKTQTSMPRRDSNPQSQQESGLETLALDHSAIEIDYWRGYRVNFDAVCSVHSRKPEASSYLRTSKPTWLCYLDR